MASISRHNKGWRAQVQVKGQRDSAVHRTRREADSWAAARETELRTMANASPGERHTLAQAIERYLVEVSPQKRGHRWEVLRLAAFMRDFEGMAKQAIGRLTTEQLGRWRDARMAKVSPGTVLREIGMLSVVLESARREWQWVLVNPVANLRKPRGPDFRKVVITRHQIKVMLSAMGYSPRRPIRTVAQSVGACFLLALRTGMRGGELCALRWDRVHDGFCTLPVTKTVPRDVPLTGKALRLIGRMQGWDDVLVFGLKSQTRDALFRRYRVRAGLAGFTFHDSRHTAATWISGQMKSSGLPAQQAVFDLCKMFGWSNVNQALVYYNPSAAEIAKRIG